jgi:hypothetical protein
MFNEAQKQLIIEIVQLTADGMYTQNEMIRKLDAVCKEADPKSHFASDLEALGIQPDDGATMTWDQAAAIMSSTSTMAQRP